MSDKRMHESMGGSKKTLLRKQAKREIEEENLNADLIPNHPCPFDHKQCEIKFYDDLEIDRSCRYGYWNNNIENPKCGINMYRKKKSAKPKSKRITKKVKRVTKKK